MKDNYLLGLTLLSPNFQNHTRNSSKGVVAVPAFVLFRNGVRYGVVSTSKVPSDRLDKAISDLEAGEDFDTSLEEEDDED